MALREATEETGIDGLRVLVPAVDLDLHEVDHGDALGRHLHLDLRFVVLAPPDAVDRRATTSRSTCGGSRSASSRTWPTRRAWSAWPERAWQRWPRVARAADSAEVGGCLAGRPCGSPGRSC